MLLRFILVHFSLKWRKYFLLILFSIGPLNLIFFHTSTNSSLRNTHHIRVPPCTEIIGWFTEDQAFSTSYDLAPLPSPPHPLPSVSSTGYTKEDWKKRQLADGRGGKRVGEGAWSHDVKKVWSSINHSILSGAVSVKITLRGRDQTQSCCFSFRSCVFTFTVFITVELGPKIMLFFRLYLMWVYSL
jgi:hypothetical protein